MSKKRLDNPDDLGASFPFKGTNDVEYQISPQRLSESETLRKYIYECGDESEVASAERLPRHGRVWTWPLYKATTGPGVKLGKVLHNRSPFQVKITRPPESAHRMAIEIRPIRLLRLMAKPPTAPVYWGNPPPPREADLPYHPELPKGFYLSDLWNEVARGLGRFPSFQWDVKRNIHEGVRGDG